MAGWKDQCRILGDDLARCRQELAARAAATHGEVWYWQGDGDDHPESLTCPVIITADKLRALLAPSAQGRDIPQGARAVELLREAQKRVSRKWRGHQFDALWLEINDYLASPQPINKETK